MAELTLQSNTAARNSLLYGTSCFSYYEAGYLLNADTVKIHFGKFIISLWRSQC